MDDWDFEHFVADLWSRQGWTTEVEQQSADAGVDVRATKETPFQQKALIQAKRYGENTTVGGPDIQQYASLKHQEDGVDQVVIVTTGAVTSQAEARASDLNVKLVDGDDLVQLVDDLDAYDLVEQYADLGGGEIDTEAGGSGESAGERSASEEARRRIQQADHPSDVGVNYPKIIAVCGAVGFMGALLGSLFPEGSLPYQIFYGVGTVFILIAVAGVYLDMRTLRIMGVWRPSKWYLYGSLIILGLPVYLYHRRRHVPQKTPAGE
ncbi:hypothetical protein GCM10009017_12670 [Halarchaeum rubridurum]|nr:hypothetical protein GCM10009017_12670 [Halarchaeum rubridurum]